MSSYKTLHIIDHLALGGAQRGVNNIVRFRDDDLIFCLNDKIQDTHQLVFPDRVVYTGGKSFVGHLFLLPRLVILLATRKFDIVHCHLQISWIFGVILSLLISRKGPRYIFHERGAILAPPWYYKYLVKIAAKRGRIITNSYQTRDKFEQYQIDIKDIQVLHNAVDTNYFKPEPKLKDKYRQEYGIDADEFVIGFAGRIVQVKGWDVLIETMVILNEVHKLKLIIAGVGPKQQTLLNLIANKIVQGRVEMLGFQDKMYKFYNSLDICVVPSFREPLGRVQLEAQACGIPVIASNIPGILETISEENAFLVPAGDPSSLADAIMELMQNAQIRNKLSQEGLRNASRFSLQSFHANLEAIYADLCG